MEEEPEEGLLEPGKQELKTAFIQLRAKGYSLAKIARRLKVSKTTLANWSQGPPLLAAALKAQEQAFLEVRLERIEAVLASRTG